MTLNYLIYKYTVQKRKLIVSLSASVSTVVVETMLSKLVSIKLLTKLLLNLQLVYSIRACIWNAIRGITYGSSYSCLLYTSTGP